MHTQKTALVLGASGGVGGEIAMALKSAGWRVRGLVRDVTKAPPLGVDWVSGDAMRPETVLSAAVGADLIVHAVNPPGYRDWDTLVLPMLDGAIAAAKAVGADILMPGTVYNYGPDVLPLVAETAAQTPLTRKGAIRVTLEQRLEAAAEAGTRVLIVRAGDFFGPRPGNNWFSQGMIKPGHPVGMVNMPGRKGVGHSWAYLPDLAQAMVQLVARMDDFAPFETFHFAGHFDHDNRQLGEAIRRVTGQPRLTLMPFPWPVVGAVSPFVPLLRELYEMRDLWRQTLELDNRKLVSVLGEEPHTPLDQAIRRTLLGLGCLDETKMAA